MRKAALALAALAAFCLTSTADAAKKKAAAADPAIEAQNNTGKFVGDAIAPWQAKNAAMPAKKAKKGKKKSKKK